MTSMDRTAYHRFQRTYSATELSAIFTPTPEEMWFAETTARQVPLRLSLLVLLKCFPHLGYFPALVEIPSVVIAHIRSCLRYSEVEAPFGYDSPKTLSRHRAFVRDYLGVHEYGKAARHAATVAMAEAAQRMERPADLINVALEVLAKDQYEIPAFSTIDTLAHRIRTLVNTGFYQQIDERLNDTLRVQLDTLLVVQSGDKVTGHTKLKTRPGNVTLTHLKHWEQHLTWLNSLGETAMLVADIPHIKISHWADEARAPEAQTIASVTAPKRYALLVCLLHEEQMAARDALTTMFMRAIAGLHDRGKTALEALRVSQRQAIEHLVATLDSIACVELAEGDMPDDAHFGELVRTYLDELGGAEVVHAQCQAVMTYRNNNHLPLLLPLYPKTRPILFKIARTLSMHASSSDDSVAKALEFIVEREGRKGKTVEAGVSLSFANEDWQKLVTVTQDDTVAYGRHALELCIFSAVADELKTGDLWVEGAQFADLRAQLLPREQCAPKIAEFCAQVGLPATPEALVDHLQTLLTETAEEVDRGYPQNRYIEITEKGEVILKRRKSPKVAQEVLALEAALLEEMASHSVLEGLRNVQYWTNFTQFFGPFSGSEPKLDGPIPKYLLTVFGYGTNMGPAQLARHAKGVMSAPTVGRINARHISLEGIDRAIRAIIDTYYGCELPHTWGNDKVASADGTMQELREGNLMTEYHVRYGRFGGIAFHYVSSLYIALLSHFIPCGAWEGIYLIDAYLQNQSLIQPDTIHTDTQGQSAPIWAMAFLLGINLMPRIRNWRGVTMYRPMPDVQYAHIDTLFTKVADWDLIKQYWEDLMQAMISIKEGRILPSTLLRKLGNYSRKNKLYQVFKAVGDVVRTIFLLKYLSRIEVREVITQETNKVEAYNGYCDWVAFAGEGVFTGMDQESFAKRVKYTDLLANALILHNVVEMTAALERLKQRGYPVLPEVVARLSPYLTRIWQRFGEYGVDMDKIPAPLAALARLFAPQETPIPVAVSS